MAEEQSPTPTPPASVYAHAMTPDQRAYIRCLMASELKAMYDLHKLYRNEANAEIEKLTNQVEAITMEFAKFLNLTEERRNLIITRSTIVNFMEKEGIK